MKKPKINIYILLFTAFFIILHISCSSDSGINDPDEFRVGIVFDEGGKGDMSFNANAWRGAMKAKDEFAITVKDVEPGDASMIEPAVRTFAEQNFDLIIGVGFATKEAIEKVAGEFPETHFAIVDSEVDKPNVASLMFSEHEGAFIVGMIAASLTKSGTIGYVGGMKIPLIIRVYLAYKAGAEYIDPDINVLENYAGITMTAWSDPNKGKELALAQVARDADIIFQAAGATGMGVFDAVEEKRVFVIGSDANQNHLKPGFVLTTMLKRLDVAVYEIIRETISGSFRSGVHLFDLENNGMDYSVDEYNRDLIPAEIIRKVEEAKKAIIAGTLKVPDYYETLR
ncbi:BMP family protein [candidate division KSB1 bacterium]